MTTPINTTNALRESPAIRGRRTHVPRPFASLIAVVMLAVAACGSADDASAPGPESSAAPTATDPSISSTATDPTTSSATGTPDDIVGTTIRFTRGDTHVDVTITEDNPTVRDLLSMLPLTLGVEELNGREKITYLRRALDTVGSPGHDPENGDLIYYAPWGNLGFYYNADGIDFSDQTIQIGGYDATVEQLTELEGDGVNIDVIR